MSVKAGIWIDREHATVVVLNNKDQELKSFGSESGEPFPQTVESRAEHEYTKNDYVPEDRLQRKQASARTDMYDAVLQFVSNADSLYVIGPGEAKKEFQKHIKQKGSATVAIEIEASDKMTEPQLAAKVRAHFNV